METLQELYSSMQWVCERVYPYVRSSALVNSVETLAAQSVTIFYTLLTSPSELLNLLPSIISTLALTISIYWTITSAIRATRTAWNVSLFFLKYGTIVIALLGVTGWLYPDQSQRPMGVSDAIVSGWHVLTRSDPRAASLEWEQRRPRKPWEKFISPSSPPSANTRSKSKKAKLNPPPRSSSSKSRSKRRGRSSSNSILDPGSNVIGDFFSWWPSGEGDEEGAVKASMTRRVLEWAVQKVWSSVSVGEWPNIEVPKAIKGKWDGFKDILGEDVTSRDETDGTWSR